MFNYQSRSVQLSRKCGFSQIDPGAINKSVPQKGKKLFSKRGLLGGANNRPLVGGGEDGARIRGLASKHCHIFLYSSTVR